MNNKNNVILVLVAILFLIGGYFLGVNKNPNLSKDVATTTTNGVSEQDVATTSKPTPTTQVVIKKPVQVITSGYVRIGQRMLINGVFVTPLAVGYDSRCPKDVQCIQAGGVDLGVLLESGTHSQNTIITSGKPFIFAEREVTLVSVSPAKLQGKTIASTEYRFTIVVK